MKIMSIPSDEAVRSSCVARTMARMTRGGHGSRHDSKIVEQTGMDEASIAGYLASMSDEELYGMFSQALVEQYHAQYAAQVGEQLGGMTNEQMAAALNYGRNPVYGRDVRKVL